LKEEIAHMAKVKDKTAGLAKEVSGEILGDGKLAEEGRAQRRGDKASEKALEEQKPLGPLEHLRNLT
jgi:uncharacterized protein YjbJ (UPF0337 family)